VLLGACNTPAAVPVIATAALAVIDTKTTTARMIATGIIRGASFAPPGRTGSCMATRRAQRRARRRWVMRQSSSGVGRAATGCDRGVCLGDGRWYGLRPFWEMMVSSMVRQARSLDG
jgi:hypothetical protein